MKKIILILFTIFTTLISVYANDEPIILPSQIGIVEEVQYVDFAQNGEIQTKQSAKIKLCNGANKGEIIYVDNMLTGNPYYDIKLNNGVKVILHVEEENGIIEYSIEDLKRSGVLGFLSVLFCGLLIYVGKQKGVYSLFSIILTCILIYYCLSPLILLGVNPIFATLLICIASTAVTLYLVGGFNKKSSSAVIGCLLSIIAAGCIAYITVKLANLTGLANENSIFLYAAHPELDFVSITVSMIIIATLGAVMDVGMSIASTINEIYVLDNTKTVKELFLSGMNVGRDIIGTMANTLILVYVGGALPLLLLASNIDFQKFINLNQVVTEISAALIGSIAIVICVPVTAFVASELVKRISENVDFTQISN